MGTFTFQLVKQLWKNIADNQTFFLFLGILMGYLGLAVSNALGFSTVMVATISYLFLAIFVLWQHQEEPTAVPLLKTKKKKHSRTQTVPQSSVLNLVWQTGVVLLSGWLLMTVFTTWDNDRRLAAAKRSVLQGDAGVAYEEFGVITKRAPGEAVFWDEYALLLARIAAGLQSQDNASSQTFANQAVVAIDQATSLNPVHLNIWKTRVRVFLLLAQVDPAYLEDAVASLDQARLLAPTDAKLTFNLAVIYKTLGQEEKAKQNFEESIRLRPIFEDARWEYARFLQETADLEGAKVQYEYINTTLKPNDPEAVRRLKDIEASLSADIPS